ncbi:HEPN domain-containing protein [Candidatus Peregrinibacteria bacterium]|nr:HEPN domain-containing protein [Candidatus Peregrinibacteria bacterium]
MNEGCQYPAALFHRHLAVEKALKALYMEEHRREAPLTHDLLHIALQGKHEWTNKEKEFLADLNEYAVAARYDDPLWAEREATAESVTNWIRAIEAFLSSLFS